MATFWQSLFLFVVLASALQYLVGGAKITEPIRVLLPQWAWFQYLLRCPGCCGAWVGAVLSWLGYFPYWGAIVWPWASLSTVPRCVVGGLIAMVLVPVTRGLMVELHVPGSKASAAPGSTPKAQ